MTRPDFTDREQAALVLLRQLVDVASLTYAYELGARHVETTSTSNWYPGCEHPSDRALLACEYCGELYAAESLDTKQATDCAASVRKHADGRWLLVGHYGSRKYDMDLYEWREFPADHAPTGFDPVCDRCITKLIADGALAFIAEHVL